jgi:hypothetical protein
MEKKRGDGMYGLAKIADYTPIKEGENLARRNQEYYDHVPESTGYGSVLGAATGVGSGALAGWGLGATANRVNLLANENRKFRIGANQALKGAGFDVDIRNITKKFPKAPQAAKWGAGIGLLGGALTGAYKGMMTGVGMNDRQYLLQRDIEPHEMVSNSAMSAMNMSGPSLNPAAPVMNQAFGAQLGALRRTGYKNTAEGNLEKK